MSHHADTNTPLHLFCLPYAGGSAAAIYGRWGRLLPASIRVVPLELAGHGRRTPDPFHDSLEAAVADMLASVAPTARQAPYAFYGHSMGTALVYELVKAAATAGLPPPRALFLSGRNPPHHPYVQRNMHLLSDELFLTEIHELGGTPEEFFTIKDLVRTFMPVLRSDYRLIERYKPALPIHVTPADIVFLCSNQDGLVGKPAVFEWMRYTSGSLEVRDFKGGHFFINDHASEICCIIQNALTRSIA